MFSPAMCESKKELVKSKKKKAYQLYWGDFPSCLRRTPAPGYHQEIPLQVLSSFSQAADLNPGMPRIQHGPRSTTKVVSRGTAP